VQCVVVVRAVPQLRVSSLCAHTCNVRVCVGAAGMPLNASRDVNLIGLAWVLPGLILPMGLAHMFKLFSDPYRVFFLMAAVLITIQSPILLGVHPKLTAR
jgi:hypothetical protein